MRKGASYRLAPTLTTPYHAPAFCGYTIDLPDTMAHPIATIGFVTSELFPVTRGGAGMLLYLSARNLLGRGHAVHFLLDAPNQMADAFRREHQPNLPNPNNLTLTTIAELLGSPAPSAIGPATWYQQKSQQWYLATRAWLARYRIDVIEYPDFYGFGHTAIAAHRWADLGPSSQFVIRLHTTMEQLQEQEIGCYVDRAALFMQEQERAALRNADAIMAPSRSRADATATAYGLAPEKMIISPPVVDSEAITPGGAHPRDTILFLGRLFHVKGADIFVDGAVHLLETTSLDPRIRFVLIGYDSNMAPGLKPFELYLRSRIPPRLADRFQFTGQIKLSEVGDWLRRSLCYVCPSRTESFAYTVHEAAAAGVPLVLTDIDGFADYFQHGENCLKFDGSAGDLASKLSLLLSNQSLQSRLARRQVLVTEPLGNSYEQTAARAHAPNTHTPHDTPPAFIPVAIILKTNANPRPPRFAPAEHAIRTAWPHATILRLDPPTDSARQTIPLLGRLWSVAGQPTTTHAVLLCLDSDQFDPDYLRAALHAMATHPELGSVSPFAVPDHPNPAYLCEPLDVQLPVWPLLHDAALTRSLMRTTPGIWLGDLFDRRVEAYGEIDYLWQLQDRKLAAYQWPHACAALADTDILLNDNAILQSILLRGRNPLRMASQSRFLPQMLAKKTTETLVVTPQPPVASPPPTIINKLLRRLKKYLP